MEWWMWVLVGIGLLVVEMATPGGLFALFFGVGALVVAALSLVGVGGRLAVDRLHGRLGRAAPHAARARCASGCASARRRPWTRSSARRSCSSTTCRRAARARPSCAASPWSARAASGVAAARGPALPRRARRRPHAVDPRRVNGASEGRRIMEGLSAALVIAVVVAAFALFVVVKTAVVVPQQSAYVVERLGKFHAVLDAGFHVLVPFFDAIRYRHTLKEQALDIPEQICITRDNVQVGVDGVLYLKVLDAAARLLRDQRLLLRDQPARPDHAAQRDRQDRARPHVRGAHAHQRRRSSPSSTRRPAPGASRCSATRSRTSRRRRTCSPRWRSRCAPSARSAR